jgi:hypothetical protein
MYIKIVAMEFLIIMDGKNKNNDDIKYSKH